MNTKVITTIDLLTQLRRKYIYDLIIMHFIY